MRALLVPVVASVALGTLVGCGGGSSATTAPGSAVTSASAPGPTAPVASVASSPSPAPSSTLWSVAEAGRQYLSMVAPGNKLIDKLNVLPSSATYKQWTPLCKQVAAAEDGLARGLVNGKWPTSVQGTAQKMAEDIIAERTAYQQCANATSDAAVVDALTNSTAAAALKQGNSDGELMRVKLGLPGT